MPQKIHIVGGVPHPYSQSLSKPDKDKARWVTHDNVAYLVDFGSAATSPFTEFRFSVPAKGKSDYATLKSNVPAGPPPTTWEYDVTVVPRGRKRRARMKKKMALTGGPDVEILP